METLVSINKINALQQELAGYMPLSADAQQKLDEKFRLEFNYHSNHIEGNTLTYGETMLFLIFDRTTGNHEGREYEEMKASDVALKLIQEYAAETERPLTEKFIKDLNELVLVKPYWSDAITPSGQHTRRLITIGNYKSQPNSVKLQNGEMFHYASPEETPALMGDMIDWYRAELEKKELHPVALAALLHYKFVRIHPFDDGNGRISRLLMNYVLYAHGLPPVIVKSADKKQYLFALNQADSGDMNAFVEYIVAQMVWSLETSIKAAKGESIEEQDDLDKKISVWKKGVNSKNSHAVVAKSESVMNSIYFEQIRHLISLFEQKLADSFGELFVSWETKGAINNSIPTKEGKLHMDSFFGSPFGNFASISIPSDQVNSLELIVCMNGFKKYLKNPFSLTAQLKIIFNQYDYEISVNANDELFFYKKAYHEVLSENERQAIVMDAKNTVFSYLKSQPETPAL